MPKPKFTFNVPDQEILTQALEQQHRSGINDYDAFYLQNGITQFRVLPPHSNCNLWFKEILKHRITVGERTHTKICPSMFDAPCPICEKARELYNLGDEASVEMAKSLRPTKRYAVNGIIFASPPGVESEAGKIYVVELPKTVKDELLEMDCDVQGGLADITGAFSASKNEGLMGISFRVTRTGQGLNTRYSTRPVPIRTDLTQELAALGVDINSLELYDLSSIFKCGTYADLKQLLDSAENQMPKAQALPKPTAFSGVGQTGQLGQQKTRVSVGKILPPPPAPEENEESLDA